MTTIIEHKKASYFILYLFVFYFLFVLLYMFFGKEKKATNKNLFTQVANTAIAQKSFSVYTSCVKQSWGLFTPLVHYNAEVYLVIKDSISNKVVDSIGMVSYFAKRKTDAWFFSSTHEAYDHLFYNCTFTLLKRMHYLSSNSIKTNFEKDSIINFQLKNIQAFIPIIAKQKNIVVMLKQYKLQFAYLPIASMNAKNEMLKPTLLYATNFFNLEYDK